MGGTSSPGRGSQAPSGGASPGQKLSPRREGPPVVPATKETMGTRGATQPDQKQLSSSMPRQLLIYDETPAGRPLPTLRDIR